MIKTFTIPAKQIAFLSAAQTALEKAQRDLAVITQTIGLGLEIEGKIVSVDTALNTISVEIPDEEPKA